ncbi:DUF3099 domain-containing protein [Nakamurella lactea]|uniref:DUF3099 domain-containing protein n=1 Tax=Nakamurella lactea TaxID=459515 RepID=UPI0003FB99F7|nr:DUF3099 domain-containing protein [Nakamurella lactea]
MPTRGHQPTLITEAELSYADQFKIRRRRYVIMMAMRVPFLIAAAATYHTPWLAITLICVSIPLPWMAVLVANDRPARKQRYVRRGTLNTERALTSGHPAEIVEASQPHPEP